MTNNHLEEILDECIDRINRGESIDSCLADYPEYAQQLRPLIQVMFELKRVYSFQVSPSAKRGYRKRLADTIQKIREKQKNSHPLFPWLIGWRKVWVTAAAVAVTAFIIYFGFSPMLMPKQQLHQPDQILATLNPEGNFAFLISDEANAIDDFQKLEITISKISIQAEANQLIEVEPEVNTVDLTDLVGDRAQIIWHGDIPNDKYTKVLFTFQA